MGEDHWFAQLEDFSEKQYAFARRKSNSAVTVESYGPSVETGVLSGRSL